MALPSSGNPIKMSQVNVELGLSASGTLNVGNSVVRNLFGVASGPIKMSNGYDKSSLSYVAATTNNAGILNNTFVPDGLMVDGSNNKYVLLRLYATYATTVLVKYSNAGTVLWARQIGDLASGRTNWWGHSITLDSSGNVHVFGEFIFNQAAPAYGSSAMVTKFDSNGNFIYNRYITPRKTATDVTAISSVIDSTGNIIGVGSLGYPGNAVLMKYDPGTTSPSLIFYKSLIKVSQIYMNFSSVDVDSSDNIYCLGNDAVPASVLLKYNSGGTLQWAKSITTVSGLSASVGGLCVDASGNIYMTQSYIGGYNPTDPVAILWIHKFDTNGTLLWTNGYKQSVKGNSFGYDGQTYGIDVDSNNNLYVTVGLSGYTMGILKINGNTGGLLWGRRFRGIGYTGFAPYYVRSSIGSENLFIRNDVAHLTGAIVDSYNTVSFTWVVRPDGSGTGSYTVATGTYGASASFSYTLIYEDAGMVETASSISPATISITETNPSVSFGDLGFTTANTVSVPVLTVNI